MEASLQMAPAGGERGQREDGREGWGPKGAEIGKEGEREGGSDWEGSRVQRREGGSKGGNIAHAKLTEWSGGCAIGRWKGGRPVGRARVALRVSARPRPSLCIATLPPLAVHSV